MQGEPWWLGLHPDRKLTEVGKQSWSPGSPTERRRRSTSGWVNALLDTLAELHRPGVILVIHNRGDDCTTVETGELLVAADLPVDARRRYRVEASRCWADSGQSLRDPV
jgi:hypothetical protein